MSVRRYDTTRFVEVREYPQGTFVLHSDYAALEARHDALREAVAWERECISSFDDDGWVVDMMPADAAIDELGDTITAACAEVDRLIANESAADCKGEG